MLGIFVKGPWYSTFITAQYEYSTQNSFSVKLKFVGKCGQSPQSTLAILGCVYTILALIYNDCKRLTAYCILASCFSPFCHTGHL